MKTQDVLKKLGLNSEEDGISISVHRIFHNEYTVETCLYNPKKTGICGHYGEGDYTNELTGLYKIASEPMELYCSSGLYDVWVEEINDENTKKAKYILRDIFKEKIKRAKRNVKNYKTVLKQIKWS